MLSVEDNALIGQVGPGSPMGELLRRFWVPFIEAARVERMASDPVEVELLGERLIAYRDGAGRYALIESACPHRGAPLYYGRNEGDGLRCIYHGWKFAADGRCVEMPSEPAKSAFKDKVRVRSYEVREMAGILWAYMGPPETAPALPHIEWANVPASQRNVVSYNQECNWVQALEGDIDSSHVGFLHRGALARESAASRQDNEMLLYDTSPALGRRVHRLRHDARGAALHQRPGAGLLARQSVVDALRDDDSDRPATAAGARARLDAAERRPNARLVRHLVADGGLAAGGARQRAARPDAPHRHA